MHFWSSMFLIYYYFLLQYYVYSNVRIVFKKRLVNLKATHLSLVYIQCRYKI